MLVRQLACWSGTDWSTPIARGPRVGQRSDPESLTGGGILAREDEVIGATNCEDGTVDGPVIGSIGGRELRCTDHAISVVHRVQ